MYLRNVPRPQHSRSIVGCFLPARTRASTSFNSIVCKPCPILGTAWVAGSARSWVAWLFAFGVPSPRSPLTSTCSFLVDSFSVLVSPSRALHLLPMPIALHLLLTFIFQKDLVVKYWKLQRSYTNSLNQVIDDHSLKIGYIQGSIDCEIQSVVLAPRRMGTTANFAKNCDGVCVCG